MSERNEHDPGRERPPVSEEATARLERDLPAMQAMLIGFFRRRFRDSAVADLVQVALLRMTLYWGRIAPGDAWEGYLLTIAGTVAVDEYRKLGRRREVAWPTDANGRPWDVVGGEDPSAEVATREALERAAASLGEEGRRVWQLYANGCARCEVARLTGLSYAKVARYLRQVERALD